MPGSIHPFSTLSVTPQDYNDLIEELNRQVSTQHPDDVLQFCCDFFHHKLSEERLQNRNPTLTPGNNNK